MPNPLKASTLRRTVDELIKHGPIHVQRWVLISGDGFSTSNSWAYSWSWCGLIADGGRQVFRQFHSEAGDASTKSFVIVLPHNSGAESPQRGDELRLYDLQGNLQGRYFANFVQEYHAGTVNVNANTRWKTEILCDRIE